MYRRIEEKLKLCSTPNINYPIFYNTKTLFSKKQQFSILFENTGIENHTASLNLQSQQSISFSKMKKHQIQNENPYT